MRYLLICCLIICAAFASAQDSVIHKIDSIKKADTSTHPNRRFDSSIFTDANLLTTSDYLNALDKMQETLNKATLITSSFDQAPSISKHLITADSAINIIREGLAFDTRVLSLRNIQMFQTLIDNLQQSNNKYIKTLNVYDAQLDSLKRGILNLRKDTVLRKMFRDTVIRKTFTTQLQQIRPKWKLTDTVVKQATALINNLKTQASENNITLSELEYQTNQRLEMLGPLAFSKEVPYLWQPQVHSGRSTLLSDYKKSADNLNAASRIYFANTRSQRLWLLAGGILFFFWIFYNYRTIKKRDKIEATKVFHFVFVNPLPVATSFIVMLTIAPLLDLDAPAIYLESIQFVLMIILTGVFWRRWPRTLFYSWCIIFTLFLVIPVANLLNPSFTLQRWLMFLDDAGACLFGLYFFKHIWKTDLRIRPNLLIAAGFYSLFNFLAVLANVSGRITLTKIFGTTAVYGFAQMVSLTVFVRIITEAFLLQMLSSRLRKNFPETFDFVPAYKKIDRAATVIAIILWLIVFTTNLNLYNTITSALQDFFTTPRQIGSLSFTIWGVILFIGIIWLANSLQKYIAYFFGDTGDDTGIDNRGARSRLLITRLILLIAGFLIAVAASGLPVDKITVIIGALGVGIGLGLQSIVNNFVSGIILIFDKPLRIGDVVELGDKKGRVKQIGIRASTLLTADGAEVIIPNGTILSNNIVNWTLTNNQIRAVISFSVEKLVDEKQVKKDINEIIKTNDNVVKSREPEMFTNNISSKSIQISFMFWCIDVIKVDAAKSDISKAIYDYLNQKEINIL